MIGLLALQGGFDAHASCLESLGIDARLIRMPHQFEGIDGLILPGGESTTMLKLLKSEGMIDPIMSCAARGIPILGTCAGAILLCRHVINPQQESLGLIPATIERNAYGCQRESFEASIAVPLWDLDSVKVCFIRAPRFVDFDDDVTILSSHAGQTTGVQYRNITAITYHPELSREATGGAPGGAFGEAFGETFGEAFGGAAFHRAWLRQAKAVC